MDLRVAHTATAAALVNLIKHKRDFYDPERAKKDEEAKALAITREAYKAFGLEIGGVSTKLKAYLKEFDNLSAITGKNAASMNTLVKAFEKIGGAVKNAADFEKFTEALVELKKRTDLTEADFVKLAEIAKKAFDGIRNSASDLKTMLDEEFRIFDIEEQKVITEEWKSYIASTNTEHAITEKTHNKNLAKIHLDGLRKRMVSTNIYYDSLKNNYKVDLLTFQEAMLAKEKAEQAYLKAQVSFDKPDTSGTSGRKGKTNDMKLTEELFDAALDHQMDAAKTMNLELKASYDTQVFNTKE